MGEEIKYEPVFGDQSLFEDAPDDAIAIRVNDYKLITYYFLTEEHLALTNSRELKAIPIIAMRRIIRTPTWNIADQKAGKFPEVGAKVIRVDHEDEGCNVIGEVIATWRCAENNESSQTCLRLKDGTLFLVECYSELRPIETPAEKAARLKSEWCAKAAKQLKNFEYTSTLTSIYDALLSGELKTPESTE